MKYAIVTFGCRVNQADSFQIEEQLIAAGGSASAAHHADLVVVNTCSVTSSADQGTRQIVRKIARENPAARIVVTGCYATRRPDEVAALPGVVQIVPNDRKEFVSGARTIGLDDGAAVRRRRWRVRRGDRARPGGTHRLHSSRADRLRSDVLVLHHPVDAWDGAQQAACARCCQRSTA